MQKRPLRLLVAIVGGIFWSVLLTILLYVTLGVTLLDSGGITAKVPVGVVILLVVLGCAWGIGTAVFWYRRAI